MNPGCAISAGSPRIADIRPRARAEGAPPAPGDASAGPGDRFTPAAELAPMPRLEALRSLPASAVRLPAARLPAAPRPGATRYRPVAPGCYLRQEGHFVWGGYESRADGAGRTWKAFMTLERDRCGIRVLDGDGRVRLDAPLEVIEPSNAAPHVDALFLVPDARRLYVAMPDSLRAIDLDRGVVVGRVERHGTCDKDSLAWTRDGHLWATDRDAVREFTADLGEVQRVPVQGFIPRHLQVLPGGDVVVRGPAPEAKGQIGSDGTMGHAVVGRDGHVRLESAAGRAGCQAPDGSYILVERVKGRDDHACRYDPATGTAQRFSLGMEVETILPRADGSFLAKQKHEGQVVLFDARGHVLDRFGFPYLPRQLAMSRDGRSALAVALADGYDVGVFRLDLERPPAARLFARLHPGGQPVGPSIYRTTDWGLLAVPLADDRVLVVRRGPCELLSRDGSVVKRWRSWEEARAEQGVRFPPPGEEWEARIQDVVRVSRDQFVTWSPAEAVGGESVPGCGPEGLPMEVGLKKLWERPQKVAREVAFPVSSDLSMGVGPRDVTILRAGSVLTTVKPFQGRPQHVTDAVALDAGGTPYCVVGTEEGDVWIARVDQPHGGKNARCFPLGSPVRRVGLEGTQVVAVAEDQALLVLDLPLEPGETVVAGGDVATAASGRGQGLAGPTGPTIEDGGTEVVIGGIRLPKRPARDGRACGPPER